MDVAEEIFNLQLAVRKECDLPGHTPRGGCACFRLGIVRIVEEADTEIKRLTDELEQQKALVAKRDKTINTLRNQIKMAKIRIDMITKDIDYD